MIPAPGVTVLEGHPRQERRSTGCLPGSHIFLGFGTCAGSWTNFETPYWRDLEKLNLLSMQVPGATACQNSLHCSKLTPSWRRKICLQFWQSS
jgi:hypothetical protein